jgi:hypothetical protein
MLRLLSGANWQKRGNTCQTELCQEQKTRRAVKKRAERAKDRLGRAREGHREMGATVAGG